MNDKNLWSKEFEKKPKEALLSRLQFHGSLEVHDVSILTGYSIQTVRKWFNSLLEKKLAYRAASYPRSHDTDVIVDNPKRP